MAVDFPKSVLTVCEIGHVTTGESVKVITVNVKLQLAEFPTLSVADATTTYVPAWYVPGLNDTVDDRMPVGSVKYGTCHVTVALRSGGLQVTLKDCGQ